MGKKGDYRKRIHVGKGQGLRQRAFADDVGKLLLDAGYWDGQCDLYVHYPRRAWARAHRGGVESLVYGIDYEFGLPGATEPPDWSDDTRPQCVDRRSAVAWLEADWGQSDED